MLFSFDDYDSQGFYDEMFDHQGQVRASYDLIKNRLEQLTPAELAQRQRLAERALVSMGITFNVYSANQETERIMPLDIVPRVVSATDWAQIEAGLIQRITALNLFLDDVYNQQRIIKDGIIPRHVVESSKGFLPACLGLKPSKGIWCHITGTDLIRDENGQWLVLEDNLRVPSGVSYMLENRELSKQIFPELLANIGVRPVSDYSTQLLGMLRHIANRPNPNIVVLTPGIYNSAYFEHSYLAQQMGVELVDHRDLVVSGGYVKMRTTRGLEIVDVIYRRLDDLFIDPKVFRPDSVLGVPGIFEVYKKGRVAIANAPGTGVADDKVVYAYVPKMIEYYLNQSPILPNVPTYLCENNEDLTYVLENLSNLVVKEANEAGGYGMLMGPAATKADITLFKEKIKANPRNYIAQPVVSLSRVPCIIDNKAQGRHVDLRPYLLYGDDVQVVPGGLTRVALKKGSLVVNSSQGGGGKDTWVLY